MLSITDYSFQSIYVQIIDHLVKEGEIKGKELSSSGLSIELLNPENNLLNLKKLWKWCFIEGINRLSYDALNLKIDLQKHRNPGNAYKFRERWEKKLNQEGGNFDYSYGEIFNEQIPVIIKSLKNKSARFSIMNLWISDYLINNKQYNRVPCTLNIHFIPNGDHLDCHVNMRTVDVVNLLPFDIFHHTLLFRYIATETEYLMGKFYFHSNTFYAQKKRFETGYLIKLLQHFQNTEELDLSKDWKFGSKELSALILLMEDLYFKNLKFTDEIYAEKMENLSEYGKNYYKALLEFPSKDYLNEFELIKISR